MAAPFNWPARIDQTINIWKAATPDFLWAPTSQKTFLRDQAKGVSGTQVGNAIVTYGGITAPIGGSIDGVSFPTVLGMNFNDHFMGVMLVSIDDPSSVQGAFLKIGDTSGGYGYGGGNPEFGQPGSKLILLQEMLAWNKVSAGFVKGLNILTFGRTADAHDYLSNRSSTAFVQAAEYAGFSPANTTYINGYYTDRSSNARVHAVAIYRKNMTDAQIFAEGGRLCAPLLPLQGMPADMVPQLFIPPRRPIFSGFAAGAGVSLTPGNTSIAVAAFVPTLAQTTNSALTPGAATIAVAAFAPTLARTANVALTPGATALAITAFAPTLAQTANIALVPGVVGLTVATFAPTLAQSSASTFTPVTAALSLSAFAPTLAQTTNSSLVPSAAALTITTFAPTLTVGAGINLTPGLAALSLASFAPTIAKSANVTLTPAVAAIAVQTYAPTLAQTGAKNFTPATASLVLQIYAPSMVQGLPTATPGYIAISAGAMRIASSQGTTRIATR